MTKQKVFARITGYKIKYTGGSDYAYREDLNDWDAKPSRAKTRFINNLLTDPDHAEVTLVLGDPEK